MIRQTADGRIGAVHQVDLFDAIFLLADTEFDGVIGYGNRINPGMDAWDLFRQVNAAGYRVHIIVYFVEIKISIAVFV